MLAVVRSSRIAHGTSIPSQVARRTCPLRLPLPLRPFLPYGSVTLYKDFSGRRAHQRSSLALHATNLSEAWPIWASLAIASSLAQSLQKTKVGSLISAPLLAILLGLLLAASGLVPIECAAYDTVSTYLLPIAAALYLLESDIRELASTAKDTVFAFLLASIGTLVGTLVAWKVFGHLLGPEGYKICSALAASYIGGSVNFAAVTTGLGMASGNLVAAAMSADMLAMAGYLAIISSWPVDNTAKSSRDRISDNDSSLPEGKASASADSISLSIAVAVVACATGDGLAAFLGAKGFSLGFTAVIATGLSSLGITLRKRSEEAESDISPFQGAEALGGALMLLFFVTVGAAAGSISALFSTGWLTAFITLQLLIHLGVTVGLGKLFGIPMQALLTASNAAIGGPGTAVAMATSRQWTSMVRPALVLGAFGYSIGTPIGITLARLLK